jgi:hypothetical protein
MSKLPAFSRGRGRVSACALLFAAAAVALGACNDLTEYESSTTRYGAVNIRGKGTSATAAQASATVVFVDAITAAVPNSALQEKDVCAYGFYEQQPEVRGQQRAGASVGLTVGTNALTLPYEDANLRYATPAAQPFSYSAGDVAQATIPGLANVFPASSISLKLAEPILPGDITTPAPGSPFVITWNGTNDATTAVLLSLRYAQGSAANSPIEQIYCSLRDDGRHELVSNTLNAFLTSPVSSRTLSLTRFRTNETLLNDSTLLFIGSSIDTVIVLR